MRGQHRTAKRWGEAVVRSDDQLNKGIGLSRRDFMSGAAAGAAFMIVPRSVLGGPRHIPPSEKLNIAGIGIGGRGAGDLEEVGSENIVALCDVDQRYAAGVF
ncbi:MAG: twin-arginine translocation signal domain-containing protein, partial [Sedimentisphaerales bacterium]